VRISLKLSVVFCIAALFLLAVELAAVLVVDHLNKILGDTSYYNQQMEQVGAALRAVRLSPERTADHLARVKDLEQWARGDEEHRLLQQARDHLTGRLVAVATGDLEKLNAYYTSATTAAHRQLLTIHQRVVTGIIVIIINSILLFVFLTWIVRHWLVNPVADLGESMTVLANGQFEHKIRSSAGKEFDQIAASLNTIAGKLRDYEKRVTSAEKFAVVGEACTHVTHNVRSLLNAIRSLAQHESNAAGARHDSRAGFNYIIASVNKLDTWVRDLHASVAPHNPNCVPLQVEPIIHDALSLLQPRLHEHNLTVDYQAADELPDVVVDRALFEQAFVAVMTNAIEASPDNGRIGVSLKNGVTEHVTVQIQDEGDGMTAVTRAHAFEPFFTTKSDNTGLGLTIAQSIVLRHGGEIRIENAAEKGTRVSIQLPAAKKRR
jgi:signal transduction histidine kinase